MRLAVIDGYIDEPTCLGVPFFLATYIRYAAGAARLAGIEDIVYLTIDGMRDNGYAVKDADFAVIVAGNPVPGKYLGGLPIREDEFDKIASANKKTRFFCGGPIHFDPPGFNSPNIETVPGDIEVFIERFFTHSVISPYTRAIPDLDRYAVAGAFIVEQHPRFPDIICEIETGRGCPRETHCSFCIEGHFPVDFRDPVGIIAEMKALEDHGIRHFRLGKQADLFSYKSDMSCMSDGFPKPNPDMIKRLYSGIRERLSNIETLHLDNVNPGTIARYPMESAEIAQTIAEYNTPGDVAAFGMESADPKVISMNSLKASAEQVRFAIELLNTYGGKREDGIPKLLPGINLIRGLSGESKSTFPRNYEFLKSILDSGLLLRRINIRQIRMNRSTAIYAKKTDRKEEKILDAVFRNYRNKIRTEIDVPMLEKVYPLGTALRNVIVEQHRGDWSLARPISSYPIVIDIPKKLPVLSKLTCFITGHRERSLEGLPLPFDPEKSSLGEWKSIPGIGKNAGEVMAKRLYTKSVLEGYSVPQSVLERMFPVS
ncbi:MAG: hypothetical protein A2Y33_15280 [Spirochaetes bacterium GWF1_51_8]|nr:MAG: hypothetical protein A2Y33_15280 [Spirochaetes bacterium GWF1_51_8]